MNGFKIDYFICDSCIWIHKQRNNLHCRNYVLVRTVLMIIQKLKVDRPKLRKSDHFSLLVMNSSFLEIPIYFPVTFSATPYFKSITLSMVSIMLIDVTYQTSEQKLEKPLCILINTPFLQWECPIQELLK